MKRATPEEKLTLIAALPLHRDYSYEVHAIINCPYGDSTHYTTHVRQVAERQCTSCSRLDGSECVDEFLELFDSGSRDSSFTSKLSEAVTRMRDWRKSRR